MLEPSASHTSARVVKTDGLVKHNIATRQELEIWIKEQKSALLAEKRDHEFQTQEQERLVTENQRRRDRLQLEHRELSVVCQEEEGKLSARQVELEVLQAQQAKKEPVVQALFTKTQSADATLKELTKAAQSQRASIDEQMTELTRGLAMYERLGLRFEQHDSEKIIVRFTQIDPRQHDRVFSFRIRMDLVSENFVVDECEPPVPALGALTEDLNHTADFSRFIRSMRREFKQLVV